MAVRIVGVVGCTGTGKSCLSEELAKLLGAEVVEGDKCFLPAHQCPRLDLTHLWPDEGVPQALASKREDTNHPDALDWSKLEKEISAGRRAAEEQQRQAVIVDSFLLQCRDIVRRHLTDIVYLDDSNMLPGELARRKWERSHLGKRSYKEKGVSFEEYKLYFNEYVYKRYLEFGRPSDLTDVIVLDCTKEPKQNALIALQRLEERAGMEGDNKGSLCT
ncbi:hypothetical protein GUITHDRAFT_122616 [Guillardia theta CCMP2712]|uniref:Deoxynucleoside kinase domain-containing protein n=1 Tax=Guillardia theta (strain CCMP2712) TaxID=905079 RepID=L1I5L8_GUITC|nr:hypothetical protein GUITHDRAFT_122616 [Guillardia theta CCMP2712]EKX31179.1 hypothetical protein GUITHDRAFT_122616 [Guillardia theta CCMP2712]|eukprot:XP_005818159.1 hypothetical protein GUITHDRAFT_122616 [Guillardia theta CCMP2712]